MSGYVVGSFICKLISVLMMAFVVVAAGTCVHEYFKVKEAGKKMKASSFTIFITVICGALFLAWALWSLSIY